MAGEKKNNKKKNLDMEWAEFLEKESCGANINNQNFYNNEETNDNCTDNMTENVVSEEQPVSDNITEDETKDNTDKEVNTTDEETVKEDLKEEKVNPKEDKKKFKKDKKEKKDKKDTEIEELKEKLVRNMAEFDNFRKRTEKEKTAMFEIGAKSVIEKVLPVIDNFERGLDAVSEEEKNNAFVQGVDKIYKQLITTLEEIGVKSIEAVGKEFDPEYHNAVMHVDDEELGENVVAEEFQKGYMYRESVVRHSMVKVAN